MALAPLGQRGPWEADLENRQSEQRELDVLEFHLQDGKAWSSVIMQRVPAWKSHSPKF